MIMSRNDKLEQEVAALGDLPREDLVARWVRVYGCPPPKGLKRGLLERAAARHLQTRALGGLSPEAKRLLKAATRQLDEALKRPRRSAQLPTGAASTPIASGVLPDHEMRAANQSSSTQALPGGVINERQAVDDLSPSGIVSPSVPRGPLLPGTRLLREWNGRQHFVDVVDDGFLFDGKAYRSLSAIARRITGAHWSGPRFFGL